METENKRRKSSCLSFMFNFIVAIITISSLKSFATSVGPNDGSSFVNSPIAGSTCSWIDPGNAATDNGVDASAGTLANNGDYTDYIVATNFSISVPAGKVITGIEVIIDKDSENASKTKDNSLRLVQNGVISGDDMALSSSWNGQSVPGTVTYGGSSDMWGLSWEPGDFNINFGVAFSVRRNGNGGAAHNVFVDNIKVKVHYSDPLPIELADFIGSITSDNSVKLSWSTFSETNNDFFTIEKSTDALHFEALAMIDGAGNSSARLSYEFLDINPATGITYYRLKQTDFDGQYEYAEELVAIDFYQANAELFNIYPNPSNDLSETYISLSGIKDTEILVVIQDIQDREFYSKIIPLKQSGRTIEAIDINDKLVPGVYFIIGTSDNKIYNQKLIVR